MDSAGNEIIIYGKGIGFGKFPFELTDLTVIDKTFYGVDEQNYRLITEIPEEILIFTTKFIDHVYQVLQEEMNPNLVFSLSDHIHFAIQRHRDGMYVPIPYFYDLEYAYPEIHQLASECLQQINEKFKVHLSKEEVTSITMHIIDALKQKREAMNGNELVEEIIVAATSIIEESMGVAINMESYDFFRFKNHLKYFVQRKNGKETECDRNDRSMFRNMVKEYPEGYRCILILKQWIQDNMNYNCNEQELLFLMIYVNRLVAKNV